MIRFNVNLSEELHREFKIHCVTNELDMTEVVRRLIQEYLEKAKKDRKKR